MDVAIIGAGIAGCSTAQFLRESLGPDAKMTVYESEERVGGRMMLVDVGGIEVEAGAAIFHDTNQYVLSFFDQLGLKQIQPDEGETKMNESVGVWNGDRIVFQSRGSEITTKLAAVARYGPLSPLRVQKAVAQTTEKWKQVYAHLNSGEQFDSPTQLLNKLGLADLLTTNGLDWLHGVKVGDKFIDEYASPVGRIMYGQDVSMSAFATLIALAGAGLAGTLFSADGGNHQLSDGLLRLAKAEVRTGCLVNSVHRNEDGYHLETSDGESHQHEIVVMATPGGPASIEVTGVDIAESALRSRPMQVTWATFVNGTVNSKYFGVADPAKLPGAILTTEKEDIAFSSLGLVGAADGQTAYKIFSRTRPDEDLLDQIFSQRNTTEQIRWEAYPVLSPDHDLPPFRLGPDLYWANAMEYAISTMETEAVAARNVANLIGHAAK